MKWTPSCLLPLKGICLLLNYAIYLFSVYLFQVIFVFIINKTAHLVSSLFNKFRGFVESLGLS